MSTASLQVTRWIHDALGPSSRFGSDDGSVTIVRKYFRFPLGLDLSIVLMQGYIRRLHLVDVAGPMPRNATPAYIHTHHTRKTTLNGDGKHKLLSQLTASNH